MRDTDQLLDTAARINDLTGPLSAAAWLRAEAERAHAAAAMYVDEAARKAGRSSGEGVDDQGDQGEDDGDADDGDGDRAP